MEFVIKTLTPLWTGGVVSSRMDYIHETNIVGSLRWWYEAIIRGVGVNICNPTSDNSEERCHRENRVCEVCKIFGSTGWQRRFRIRLKGGAHLLGDRDDSIPLPSGRIHHRGYRAGSWYLMSSSMMGDNISIQFFPLAKKDMLLYNLRLILALVDRHAAIGGKVSNGYGVLMVRENEQPLAVDEALDYIGSLQQKVNRNSSLPDLRDFFFAKLRFQHPKNEREWWRRTQGIDLSLLGEVVKGDKKVNLYNNNNEINEKKRKSAERNLSRIVQEGLLPLAPAVRNYLRYHWNSELTPSEKNYLFGTTETVCPQCCSSRFKQNRYDNRKYWCSNCRSSFFRGQEWERIASKINISHAYQLESGDWEFRVWGWVPSHMPQKITLKRDEFLKSLHDVLKHSSTWYEVFNSNTPIPQLVEWHTLDSSQQDGFAYLKELLRHEK